ncbi:uncharacterized protein LOC123300937 [Chrysoperla carnea]|uniref:uncharacterized protein LOC123300937 n=1 Tax=Chrysoperla carnea TaxID=189513 RepID=UPI001D0900F8|nr:uncharacterized protein LOC123300937 [Chrysoperla carnea]
MITNTSRILFLIFYICVNLTIATEISGFFTSNATSNVPRIGRSGKTDFENFFLKASKSVPRIGRQTENENFDNMYFRWMKQNGLLPRYAKRMEYPNREYDDIAEVAEHNPQIMLSPQAVAEMIQLYHKQFDDTADSDWENTRFKRDGSAN